MLLPILLALPMLKLMESLLALPISGSLALPRALLLPLTRLWDLLLSLPDLADRPLGKALRDELRPSVSLNDSRADVSASCREESMPGCWATGVWPLVNAFRAGIRFYDLIKSRWG